MFSQATLMEHAGFGSTFRLKREKKKKKEGGGCAGVGWGGVGGSCLFGRDENVSFATHGKASSSRVWQREAHTLGVISSKAGPNESILF